MRMPRAVPVRLGVLCLALIALATPTRASAPAFQFAFGSAGAGAGQFNFPHGLAIAPDGSIYVGDTVNGRVQRFDANGGYVSQWPDGRPGGAAIDASGNVLVIDVDTDRVLRYSTS